MYYLNSIYPVLNFLINVLTNIFDSSPGIFLFITDMLMVENLSTVRSNLEQNVLHQQLLCFRVKYGVLSFGVTLRVLGLWMAKALESCTQSLINYLCRARNVGMLRVMQTEKLDWTSQHFGGKQTPRKILLEVISVMFWPQIILVFFHSLRNWVRPN